MELCEGAKQCIIHPSLIFLNGSEIFIHTRAAVLATQISDMLTPSSVMKDCGLLLTMLIFLL